MEFIKTLNEKIVIDNIIIGKMRYDINMIFYNSTSKEKAQMLSMQIHSQLDRVLKGVNEEDKFHIKRLIITDSFLVIKRPISNNISYGNVFTKLTNYDEDDSNTQVMLSDWLDKNTDIEYDELTLTRYIKTYKVKNTENQVLKVAAIQYEPQANVKVDDKIRDKNFYYFIPFLIALFIFVLIKADVKVNDNTDIDNIESEYFDIPPIFDTHLSTEVKNHLDNYYSSLAAGVPFEYQYRDINLKNTYEYLYEKDSILTDGNYINIIVEYSKKANINPNLLIAIIGQEQGFVTRQNLNADEIINNPYNVFGSWVLYNTSFEDSTQICLNTIMNISKDRPQDHDFISWINNTYAEDKNWSKGVSYIFTSLQN